MQEKGLINSLNFFLPQKGKLQRFLWKMRTSPSEGKQDKVGELDRSPSDGRLHSVESCKQLLHKFWKARRLCVSFHKSNRGKVKLLEATQLLFNCNLISFSPGDFRRQICIPGQSVHWLEFSCWFLYPPSCTQKK